MALPLARAVGIEFERSLSHPNRRERRDGTIIASSDFRKKEHLVSAMRRV
jgi:hypothetical protein